MMRRAGLLGLLFALGWAGTAGAGTYTVYACKKPDGTPAPTDGWAAGNASANTAATTTGCASGGPMTVSMSTAAAHAEGAYADLVFTAPAGLPVVGFVAYRLGEVGANTTNAKYNYTFFHDAPVAANFLEMCDGGPCRRGDPAKPLGEASAYVADGLSAGSISVRVSCYQDGAEPFECPAQADTSRVQLHRAAMVLEDTTDPELTATPSGTLFDGSRTHSGTISGSFSARDSGSGVFQAVVEVDGRAVATATIDDNGGRCQIPFTLRVPCKPQASGTVSLDTRTLADGQHAVRLLIRDATQTNEIAYGPVTISTQNTVATRGTPNGANAADGAQLTARWRGRTGSVLRSAFGRRVVMTGLLKAPNGTPIVGAAVEIYARNRSLGAGERKLASVTTRSDGAWSHALRAGPGVDLFVRYRAFSADPGFAATATASLRVRAAATLSLSRRSIRRGFPLDVSGRLRGGPVPRGGKDVVLQIFDGGRWNILKVVRSTRSGRFSHRFAFRRGGGTRRFRLRALVRAEDAYPYTTGRSPVRSVRVRP